MAVTQALLVEYLRTVEPDRPARRVILDLLREGLTGQAREAYNYVRDNPGCTSMDVAAALGRPANHTDNILRRLLDWQLVSREAQETREGLHYRWWKKEIV